MGTAGTPAGGSVSGGARLLRVGILGAARIAPLALVRPARRNPEVDVVAVAARDPDRARRFAGRHRIPRVAATYEDLLADETVDAVYNPLPNALHGRWTLAALEAGKHVLCEKPFAANADEAQEVVEAAAGTGLVVMEALHSRYHALIALVLRLLGDGVIGDVTHLRARFHVPILKRGDIRYDPALGGGAGMDLGCYLVHLFRTLAGAEPRVLAAQARTAHDGEIDLELRARLEFPNGITGSMSCGMRSLGGLPGVRITGTHGELVVRNFLMPQLGHWITVRAGSGTARHTVPRRPTTYDAQLAAFAGAVLRGEPFPTTPEDAVATMRVLDDCYRTAGLRPKMPVQG